MPKDLHVIAVLLILLALEGVHVSDFGLVAKIMEAACPSTFHWIMLARNNS